MRIFAIDPGLTIGYAWYDTINGDFDAGQTKSYSHVIEWIEDVESHWEDKFIIENYLSAGHLTKEAMHTIKLVGFFEFELTHRGVDVALAPPQRRLSGVARAKTLAHEKDIPGPHSWDALAHAIVAARTV